MPEASNIRAARADYTWEGVETLAYKEDGSAPFKAITRQTLFHRPELACELRYFEMAPDGYSTLERHEHVHAVMIHRGRGSCLVGRELREVAEGDLVSIPPMTWHQFRATAGEPFGFLCMVNTDRDRPRVATAADIEALSALDPRISHWLNPGG